MKYRTRQESIDFGLLIASQIKTESLTLNEIATNIKLPTSKIKHMCFKLKSVGIISYKKSITKKNSGNKSLLEWYLITDSKNLESVIPDRFRLFEKRGGQRALARYRQKLGPEIIEEKMTTRKCRDCEVLLPESRYFKCYDCALSLISQDDDFIYHDLSSSMFDAGDICEDEDFFSEDIAVMAKQTPKEDNDA